MNTTYIPLPKKGDMITLTFLSAPKGLCDKDNSFYVECENFGPYRTGRLILNSAVYKGLLAELKKNNIQVDENLNCLVGHIFSIRGVNWYTAPREKWSIDSVTNSPVPPTTWIITLRTDLEKLGNSIREEIEQANVVKTTEIWVDQNKGKGLHTDKTTGDKIMEQTGETIADLRRELVSFSMNTEVLSNIMTFVKCLDSEIPITFDKNGMFIGLMSCDHVMYANMRIASTDIIDYNIRFGNSIDPTIELLVDTFGVHLDKLYDLSILSSKRTREEFAGRDGIVEVKVFNDRVEFHCPGNTIMWAKVLTDQKRVREKFNSVAKIPDIIQKVRDNKDIKHGSVVLEPSVFNRICNVDFMSANSEKDCIRLSLFRMQIDKESGLTLSARSHDNFYQLKLKPKHLEIIPIENEKSYVIMDKQYIVPFKELKGPAPILMEIRKDKPLIIEQQIFGTIKVMLTIAPRLQNCPEHNDDYVPIMESRMWVGEPNQSPPDLMDF